MNTIYITAEDNARLRLLLLLSPYTDAGQHERELLRRELDRAALLRGRTEGPEVIRLGVTFEYEDLQTGAIETCCLCLPTDEPATREGISVLSRFGAAVIGCSVGNDVWWAEADRCRRVRIRRIFTAADAESRSSDAGAIAAEPSAGESQPSRDRAELQATH